MVLCDNDPSWLTVVENNLMLDIVVADRKGRNRIMGIEDGRLKVQLAVDPSDNRINVALVQFLANVLRLSSAQIQIVGGASNLRKTVLLMKVSRNKAIWALSPRRG